MHLYTVNVRCKAFRSVIAEGHQSMTLSWICTETGNQQLEQIVLKQNNKVKTLGAMFAGGGVQAAAPA
jgi:hypothetical protein